MTIISITGGPGVGKSFLAKQLSSYLSIPVILEGEEGTIPAWVFENVFSNESPLKRWEYFIDKYNVTFQRARQISNQNINCIIDINENMFEILHKYEKKEYKIEAKKLIENNLQNIESDIVILLKADKIKLIEMIKKRGRESEEDEEMIERTLFIQNELIESLKSKKKVIIVERKNLDFTKEEDIKFIYKKIEQWL